MEAVYRKPHIGQFFLECVDVAFRQVATPHSDLSTLMVRQLPPSELGVPLEIYCFSANKDWVAYEGIQADI